MGRATEQCDAAVEALELKMLHDAPIVINVRLAADRNFRPTVESRHHMSR